VVLARLGRHDEALASHDAAIARAPGFAEAHANRGDVLRALGRLPEALVSYENAFAAQPGFAYAYRRHGETLLEIGRPGEALASCDRSLEFEPEAADSHFLRGGILNKQCRYQEAVVSLQKAIALRPDFAEAHNSLGIALEKLERGEEALVSYAKVIELRPDMAAAFYNRANVLYNLDRPAEALASYERALDLQPDYAPARNNLFWLHVRESDDYPLIERLGVEAYESALNREFADPWYRGISNFRLVHDLEQIDYLLAHGYDLDGLRETRERLAEIKARHSETAFAADSITVIPLSAAEAADVNRFRKALFRHPIGDPPAECLNPEHDWGAIEERYFSSYPEMIYIDNLLTRQALEEFRTFCLVSVVWKMEYQSQYLGAFANMGFTAPLHLQIARELQRKMPRIFGHKLEQLWAYKYNSRLSKGINVHADVAVTNLNFWITPDTANLDPESGGLIVYDVPPPPTWSFDQYNADEKRIYEFLEKNRSGSMKVPYRCNRAVLFNSALFHETDEIHFHEGYENRRINVTYLFGRGLKT
jgi:tetratricopeptide (TPR) repeat protein